MRKSLPHEEGCVRPTYNIQETKTNGKKEQESSPDATATIRSMSVELQSCREENKRMIKDMEEKNQLTAAMLRSLKYLQR